jgi:type IV pilus assembly protein PilC
VPNFFYTAKSLDGKTKSGILDSDSVRSLAQTLKSEGLILVKADLKIEKVNRGFSFSKKVSIAEKLLMVKNLWVMVSTGLSLVKGFTILSAQSKNKKFKNALSDISQDISRGTSLSDSFRKYPDIFSEIFRGMIQAGEESGTLEEVLRVLSVQLEKEKEMAGKIKKALIYPAILIATMMVVGILLMVFAFPKISIFFKSLNAQLPITTRIILGSGDFLMKYWYFLFAGFFIAILSVIFLLKTKTGKFIIDTVAIRLPVVSSLVKKGNAASLIRSLSSLLSAGVPLIKSLEMAAGTLNNFYFKQALANAVVAVEKGEKLFKSLEPYKEIFPYGAVEMIEIGEETGKTSLILKSLAEFYEQEVSEAADNLSVIIEPVLIVILGAAVGIFAISIIGPLYSVLGSI